MKDGWGNRCCTHDRGPPVAADLGLADLELSTVVGHEGTLLHYHPMHLFFRMPLVQASGLLDGDFEAPLAAWAGVVVRLAAVPAALLPALQAPPVAHRSAHVIVQISAFLAHDRVIRWAHGAAAVAGAAAPPVRRLLRPVAVAGCAVVALQLVVLVCGRPPLGVAVLRAICVGSDSLHRWVEPEPLDADDGRIATVSAGHAGKHDRGAVIALQVDRQPAGVDRGRALLSDARHRVRAMASADVAGVVAVGGGLVARGVVAAAELRLRHVGRRDREPGHLLRVRMATIALKW